MIRDLSEKEVRYIVGLIQGGGILTAEKTKLISRLEGEKYDRELMNTSITIYRDQKELADSKRNASQFIRDAIDYYIKERVTNGM